MKIRLSLLLAFALAILGASRVFGDLPSTSFGEARQKAGSVRRARARQLKQAKSMKRAKKPVKSRRR
jgi:hypothetical protein